MSCLAAGRRRALSGGVDSSYTTAQGLKAMSHIWQPGRGKVRVVKDASAPSLVAGNLKDQDDNIASTPNNRVDWIDAAKGLGIILVVVGHTASPASLLNRIIFSFHMPLFFVVSGYLFNFDRYDGHLRRLLQSRFKSLLYPYFASGLVFFIIWLIFQCPNPFTDTPASAVGDIFHNTVLTYLYGIGQVNVYTPLSFIVPVGPAWFIVTLFVTQIFFYIFLKVANAMRPMVSLLLLVIPTAFGIYISRYIFPPWSIDLAATSVIFMFCGYSVRRGHYLERLKLWWVIVPLAIWIVCLQFSELSMNNRDYQRWPLAILGAVAASLVILVFTKRVLRYDGFIGCIGRALRYVGARALVILIVHTMLLLWLPATSLLRYNWSLLAAYAILVSLMIAEVIRAVPFLNKVLCLGGKGGV
jgi:acyltransferase